MVSTASAHIARAHVLDTVESLNGYNATATLWKPAEGLLACSSTVPKVTVGVYGRSLVRGTASRGRRIIVVEATVAAAPAAPMPSEECVTCASTRLWMHRYWLTP
jgi:hypothetical protein